MHCFEHRGKVYQCFSLSVSQFVSVSTGPGVRLGRVDISIFRPVIPAEHVPDPEQGAVPAPVQTGESSAIDRCNRHKSAKIDLSEFPFLAFAGTCFTGMTQMPTEPRCTGRVESNLLSRVSGDITDGLIYWHTETLTLQRSYTWLIWTKNFASR